MSKDLKRDILKYQKELTPFLNSLYNCNDEQQLGCVMKPKTPSPKKPSPKKPTLKIRKRCPKGTRKNKKTGNCDPLDKKKHKLRQNLKHLVQRNLVQKTVSDVNPLHLVQRNLVQRNLL